MLFPLACSLLSASGTSRSSEKALRTALPRPIRALRVCHRSEHLTTKMAAPRERRCATSTDRDPRASGKSPFRHPTMSISPRRSTPRPAKGPAECRPPPLARRAAPERRRGRRHRPRRRTLPHAGRCGIGLGLVAWSPLAFGLLTSRCGPDKLAEAGPVVSLTSQASTICADGSDGRLAAKPDGGTVSTQWHFDTVSAPTRHSGRGRTVIGGHGPGLGCGRPGASTVLIGASRPEQVRQQLAALNLALSEEHRRMLAAASALPKLNPYFIIDLPNEPIFGSRSVAP